MNNTAPFLRSYASAQMLSSSPSYSGTVIQTLAPAFYHSFYEYEVRRCLNWYDGYVPEVHGGGIGIISTNIAKTLCERATEAVFAGGLMFSNADTPIELDEKGGSVALSVVGDIWAKESDFQAHIKKACASAAAGGTSLLRLNQGRGGRLWLDTFRADQFFASLDQRGNVEKAITILTVFSGDDKGCFALVEERGYKSLTWSKRVPVQVFRVWRVPLGGTSNSLASPVDWPSLPNSVKNRLRKDYAGIRIGKERALPFRSLGLYAFRYTSGCDKYNGGLPYGESMLSPIMQYLLSYDFYFSAFNTDLYLGRGRVIAKKPHQTPESKNNQNYNSGLDSFMYDEIPTFSVEEQKPVAIQFDLRSAQWREIRNSLIENIALSIGISVGTLASFISDASNRTAREISAEESATTRFVAARREQFSKPINDCLAEVCHYLDFKDIVNVRWSLAGQTNIDALSTRVLAEYQSGVRSLKSAISALNPDMDEGQVNEEMARIENEQTAKQNALFGDIGGGTDIV